MLFQSVLDKERRGGYLGKTVQVMSWRHFLLLYSFLYSTTRTTSNCMYILLIDRIYMCFQVVPHITDAIKNWIESVSSVPVDGKNDPADVCVIELGGTVGRI